MTRRTSLIAILLVFAAGLSTADAAIIRNFNSGGIVAANHPYPTSAFNTWYDITSDSSATALAGTLDGSPSLQIIDGGFTNGVYVILPNVIPATGTYQLSARMKVNEDPAQLNSIRAYQMGAVVNGVHRVDHPTDPDDLATINPAAPGSGIGSYSGLTTGNDNGLPTQTVTTDSFNAVAGDHLLVAFSTDLDTGNFDGNSATWGAGANILVDNLDLIQLLAGISVSSSLDFGTVFQGDPAVQQMLSITNTGNAALTISGASAGSPFSVVTSPTTIAAGASANMLLEMDTSLAGSHLGSLMFATNVVGQESITVDLTGVVIPEPATLGLVALGLMGMLGAARRPRRA